MRMRHAYMPTSTPLLPIMDMGFWHLGVGHIMRRHHSLRIAVVVVVAR